LTRPQAASDLGVGLSTLNKWVQKHQHDVLPPWGSVVSHKPW
jgi:transposase